MTIIDLLSQIATGTYFSQTTKKDIEIDYLSISRYLNFSLFRLGQLKPARLDNIGSGMVQHNFEGSVIQPWPLVLTEIAKSRNSSTWLNSGSIMDCQYGEVDPVVMMVLIR